MLREKRRKARERERRENPGLAKFEAFASSPMFVLALIWIGVIVLEFASVPATRRHLEHLEYWIIWPIFVGEFAVRWVFYSHRRWSFLATHWLDLVVVVSPFLLGLGLARGVDAFRFLRAGAVLAGERSPERRRALEHKHLAWISAGLTGVVVAVVGISQIAYRLERHVPGSTLTSSYRAITWAVTTALGGSEGNHSWFPVTNLGRVLGYVLMFIKFAGVASGAGLFAGILFGKKVDEELKRLEVEEAQDSAEARPHEMEDEFQSIKEMLNRLTDVENQRGASLTQLMESQKPIRVELEAMEGQLRSIEVLLKKGPTG